MLSQSQKIAFIVAIICFALALILAVGVRGESTTQSFKQRIEYISSATKNVWYNTTADFKPISFGETVSAFITLYLDINSETGAKLLVNNQECNPKNYSIPGGTRQERIFFDCTNIINKTGKYNVSISFNSQSGTAYFRNIYGELEILYNNPGGTMKFGGTEYSSGEPATIWLQLLRNYQPLNNATCYLTVYYPNKTVFLNNTIMQHLAGSDGIYYYDLTAPSVNGVYVSSATCYNPYNAFVDNFLDYSKLEEYENVTIINGKIILYPYVGMWTALDSSGNNRSGTLANMESSDWVVGKLNGALKFDGTDEYVDLEDIANFDKEQSFSIEAWIKTTSNKTQNIISRRDTQPNIERGWEFQIKNGKLKFTVSRSTTNTYWVSQESLQSINDGNWHHVVATWTGVTGTWGYPSNIKLYIDGQLADSYPSGNVVGWSILNDAHCQISGKVFDAYNVFDGVIDEVVIYTKVLSLSEVQFRYNNGTGTETMIADVFPYGWWHLNPMIGATSGYIKSSLIPLNGISWLEYSSDYVLHNGSINFKVLSSNNTVLCNNLGNIQDCANETSSIKLYAELTKPYLNSTSPEIDNWWVNWIGVTIEELRGSGEMHISSGNISFVSEALSSFYKLEFVGGTEYQPNDIGTFGVQFLKTSSGVPSPISGGSCYGDFYYPNFTIWVSNASFVEYNGSNAIYYNITRLPDVLGTYTIDVMCSKAGTKAYSSQTFHIGLNTTQEVANANNSISSLISATNQSLSSQISGTNSSIFSKLYKIQDEITSVNDTVKSESSSILSIINSTVNYWGNALEKKLDDLILGNVTLNVTAEVDYDKIATYILLYLRGAKFWCWWMPCPPAGAITG